MKIVEGLYYTKEHEWVKVEDNKAYVGITDYAQSALGDIVFVELPELNTKLSKEDPLGVVESVKAASDIYSPISGEIIEANEALENEPELLNQNPYDNWIALIKPDDLSEIDDLMDAKAYLEFCGEE